MKRILAGLTAVSTTAIIAVSGGVAAAQSTGPTSKWCNDHGYSSSQLCHKAWKKSQHQTPPAPTPGTGGGSGGGTSSGGNVDASEHTNQTASQKGNTGAVSHGYGGGHNTTTNNIHLSLSNSYNNVIQFVINIFN